jgi:hypothetical protein
MNKTILRVQNHKRAGPYWGHGDFSFQLDHNADHAGHPAPVCDKGIERWVEANERCGFLDENQLAEWFTADDILEMCAEGFSIEQIDIADIVITAVGQKQILFMYREN